MKKRITSVILAIVCCLTGIFAWNADAKAQTVSEDIGMENIMTEDALIGYATNQSWGVYLLDGSSIINKISSTKVGAGGSTNAARSCTVSVTSILERKDSSGSWVRVTSWTVTNPNSIYAIISKSVTVPSGSYYRVRSYHNAGTDSATSSTNALLIN